MKMYLLQLEISAQFPLGGEWDNAHPSVNNQTEEVAKLLVFVVKNGHASRSHSMS